MYALQPTALMTASPKQPSLPYWDCLCSCNTYQPGDTYGLLWLSAFLGLFGLVCMPLQDMVARAGKFVVLFKRPGHRVIINSRGDMLVRPSFMEISTQRAGLGAAREGLCVLHSA